MKYIANWDKWVEGKDKEQIIEKLRELHNAIEVDDLTGLYNRRAFNRELRYAIAGFRRFGTVFSVVNIDLKKFKKINDTYGHQAGDQALTFFSGFLKNHKRDTDLIFRIGGDEFAAILTHTDNRQAEIYIKRITEDLESHKRLLEESSAGKMVFVNSAVKQWKKTDDAEKFLKELDVKMYEQKRS